jgi:hypothetical protein
VAALTQRRGLGLGWLIAAVIAGLALGALLF